ncbi:MAG: hypothetical protein KF774_16030 [Planctomyces sp.]|nr:hypothetical protein [Planctomyces sp.]
MKLPQPVITAEVVSQIPGGATQLVISPRAVVTPAALDLVRSRKLTIRRETPAPAGSPAPAARRLAIVVSGSPVLDRVLLDRTSGWRRELLGCPDDAATLAIRELSRGEVDAVLIFTSKPFRAACRANRNAQVRAVAVSGIEDLKAAVGELRVNAACVDPTGRGDFEIRRWLRTADELLRPRGAAG